VKAQGKKVKVDAILDNTSSESFLNDKEIGALELKKPYQKVKAHVLNNSVETFQTMLLTIEGFRAKKGVCDTLGRFLSPAGSSQSLAD